MGVVVLQGLFYSIQTKFQASVFSALTCPLDHPPRNQQEQSALFQPDGRSVASGVREQAERQTGGAEFRYPGVVAPGPAYAPRSCSRGFPIVRGSSPEKRGMIEHLPLLP